MNFNDLKEKEEKSSVGGGSGSGWRGIAGVMVQSGWSTYIEGIPMVDCFFPVTKDKDINEQKAACNNFIKGNRGTQDADYGYMLTVLKEHVLSADASGWRGDITKFYKKWWSSAKTVVVPNLEKINPPTNEMFYAHVSQVDDEYYVAKGDAGKKVGKDGVARFPSIMYFDEKFANKEEAMAAVSASSSPDVMPETAKSKVALSAKALENNWSAVTLEENRQLFVNQISELVASGKPLPLARKKVADEYSIDVSDLINLDNSPM